MPSLDHCLLYCLLCVWWSHIGVGGLQLMLRMLVFLHIWSDFSSGSKSFSGQNRAKPLIYVKIPLIYSCTSDFFFIIPNQVHRWIFFLPTQIKTSIKNSSSGSGMVVGWNLSSHRGPWHVATGVRNNWINWR